MNTESKFSYQPVVGDKVKFIMRKKSGLAEALPGDTGVITSVDNPIFLIKLDKDRRQVVMCDPNIDCIPHDLSRIDYIERVPTPCQNAVDIDAVIKKFDLENASSAAEAEIKNLTLHMMCREIREARMGTSGQTKELIDSLRDLVESLCIPLAIDESKCDVVGGGNCAKAIRLLAKFGVVEIDSDIDDLVRANWK